jgi:hypothetical protein
MAFRACRFKQAIEASSRKALVRQSFVAWSAPPNFRRLAHGRTNSARPRPSPRSCRHSIRRSQQLSRGCSESGRPVAARWACILGAVVWMGRSRSSIAPRCALGSRPLAGRAARRTWTPKALRGATRIVTINPKPLPERSICTSLWRRGSNAPGKSFARSRVVSVLNQLPIASRMEPGFDGIATVMEPPDRQGHGATCRVG